MIYYRLWSNRNNNLSSYKRKHKLLPWNILDSLHVSANKVVWIYLEDSLFSCVINFSNCSYDCSSFPLIHTRGKHFLKTFIVLSNNFLRCKRFSSQDCAWCRLKVRSVVNNAPEPKHILRRLYKVHPIFYVKVFKLLNQALIDFLYRL